MSLLKRWTKISFFFKINSIPIQRFLGAGSEISPTRVFFFILEGLSRGIPREGFFFTLVSATRSSRRNFERTKGFSTTKNSIRNAKKRHSRSSSLKSRVIGGLRTNHVRKVSFFFYTWKQTELNPPRIFRIDSNFIDVDLAASFSLFHTLKFARWWHTWSRRTLHRRSWSSRVYKLGKGGVIDVIRRSSQSVKTVPRLIQHNWTLKKEESRAASQAFVFGSPAPKPAVSVLRDSKLGKRETKQRLD